MTEKEILEFCEFYNNELPSPVHEPKRFEYYYRMWKYIKRIRERNSGGDIATSKQE